MVRWTLLRLVLLFIGVSFSYLMLVNNVLTQLTAPVAGLVGAIVAHRVVRAWRGRYGRRDVGETPVVELPVKQQPVLQRQPVLQG